MTATTELEKIAKLADFGKHILDTAREYGFFSLRKAPGRKAAKTINGEDIAPKRRGRPKGSRNKKSDVVTAPIESTSDIGSDADAPDEPEEE